MSKITLTAASRVGNIRSNNEDMVYAYDKFVRNDAYSTEFLTERSDRFLIALADGMGGHQAGEVASEMAVDNLRFYVNDIPSGLTSDEFRDSMHLWLQSINNTINGRGRVNPVQREMGTTLVSVIHYNGKYYWMNCGDSRLYRFRDGVLKQLTTDHSLNMLNGEAKHSNVLTNCIGAGCKDSYIDLCEFTDDFLPGDSYLLCSDGLNDMITDEHIQQLMTMNSTADELCNAAVDAGGFDNVSVCVFHVSAEENF